MSPRDEQTMAGKERPVIEECQAHLIFKNDTRGVRAGNDVAESARHSYQFVMEPSGRK